ncbi:S8 family peptidase [Planomicrobium sp. CPCC 101110]|uniref:S8 family peptidase n=1 Tax=Planomicrobium sp. CPCC 101110 TaxID=2599619 RepID=UPI0011B5D8E5|nr:S8 family peptidase [Planomicrobium sp. CPCC 101110]TWT25230.1 S8 family peptidase [Planomicrobium sp. CPCC 101110]
MKVNWLLSSVLVASTLLSGLTVSAAPIDANNKRVSVQGEATAKFIVGVKAGSSGIDKEIRELGGRIVDRWAFINTFLVELDPQKEKLLETIPGVVFASQEEEVVKNGKASGSPDPKLIANAYNSAVAADKVWEKGITGKGVTVAVVDSGVMDNPYASDFKGRISGNAKFSTAGTMADFFGHGTHVASIIGGDGSQSKGKYPGIAPGVNIVNVKISDDEGKTGEKNLVDGLQWIYEHHKEYNIRVVNISNQISTQQHYKESATNAAVELLWKAGIVVVVSAGNQGGTACSTCYAPANDPFVITVGAVDDKGTKDISDDSLKSWSSHGITADGFNKPELVAPGSQLIAHMPKGELRSIRPENIVDNTYFKMGGTSMSAPVVSGVVALMLQVNPRLTPDQVKWVLKNTARNYKEQPAGSAGIVTADAAAFYNAGNIPADAAQKFELSPLVDAATSSNSTDSIEGTGGDTSWSNLAWRNMSWSNLAWRNNFD